MDILTVVKTVFTTGGVLLFAVFANIILALIIRLYFDYFYSIDHDGVYKYIVISPLKRTIGTLIKYNGHIYTCDHVNRGTNNLIKDINDLEAMTDNPNGLERQPIDVNTEVAIRTYRKDYKIKVEIITYKNKSYYAVEHIEPGDSGSLVFINGKPSHIISHSVQRFGILEEIPFNLTFKDYNKEIIHRDKIGNISKGKHYIMTGTGTFKTGSIIKMLEETREKFIFCLPSNMLAKEIHKRFNCINPELITKYEKIVGNYNYIVTNHVVGLVLALKLKGYTVILDEAHKSNHFYIFLKQNRERYICASATPRGGKHSYGDNVILCKDYNSNFEERTLEIYNSVQKCESRYNEISDIIFKNSLNKKVSMIHRNNYYTADKKADIIIGTNIVRTGLNMGSFDNIYDEGLATTLVYDNGYKTYVKPISKAESVQTAGRSRGKSKTKYYIDSKIQFEDTPDPLTGDYIKIINAYKYNKNVLDLLLSDRVEYYSHIINEYGQVYEKFSYVLPSYITNEDEIITYTKNDSGYLNEYPVNSEREAPYQGATGNIRFPFDLEFQKVRHTGFKPDADKYIILEKTNGIPVHVVFNNEGKFLINKSEIKKMAKGNYPHAVYVGELTDKNIEYFDCIYFNKDLRGHDYLDRINIGSQLINFKKILKVEEMMPNVEGYIFTPKGKYNEICIKIKNINTIDCKCTEGVVEYCDEIITIASDYTGIVEMNSNREFIKTRPDKEYPNSRRAQKEILSSITVSDYINEEKCGIYSNILSIISIFIGNITIAKYMRE